MNISIHEEIHPDELPQFVDAMISSSSPPSSPIHLEPQPEAPVAVYSSSALPTDKILDRALYMYACTPPHLSELMASMQDYNLPDKLWRMAYYSREHDAPEKPREYAGLQYHLKGGEGLSTLEEWESVTTNDTHVSKHNTEAKRKNITRRWPAFGSGWEFASSPPSSQQVRRWLGKHPRLSPAEIRKARSQVFVYVEVLLKTG